MSLKSATLMAAIMSMSGGMLPYEPREGAEPVKTKECLMCGNLHDHNNSFCSAKCCKSYKAWEV